jgi:hypothetical protein
MAKKLIDRVKESLAKTGYEPRTREARKWLKSKIPSLRPSKAEIMRDRQRLREKSFIGRMYFYFYDPKTKDKLPYYDKFPLVIPIERYQDGFLGLNLHYIHPKQRIVLLDKLSTLLNNHEYDETTKLRIRYDYLKAASTTFFKAKPCIKRYLYTHIQSRFLEITADEWDIAVMLPVETFVKEKKTMVWKDSEQLSRR